MKEVEFGSLFQFIRNGMNVKQDKSGDGLPISRIETISDSTIDASKVGYAGLKEEECRGWLLTPGDILFSHINSVEHVGKCAVYRGVPEKLIHGMNLLCLRSDPAQLLPEFAKYLIRSPVYRSRLSNFINKAVNQASVSIGNLKTIKVSVPPISEQRRIAAILDQTDELRSKRRESLALLDSLTQSVFNEMFGDPVSNGLGWSTVKLSDVTEIVTGFAFKSEEYIDSTESSIKLCRGANILPGRLDWRDLASWPISRVGEVASFQLKTNDIVMAMDRPWISEGFKIAQISENDCPSLLVQRVARIRGLEETSTDYIYHLLNHPRFASHCRPTETTVPHISPKEIRSFAFCMPPPQLQKQFSHRLSYFNNLKLMQNKSLKKLNILFESLQHRAFRGEL
nr:restriction endonuclease subunit S [uncultured Janthinobacterium sp.]